MAVLQASAHLTNSPPGIFIFIDDPFPLVRFQLPPSLPLEILFPSHTGPPHICTELPPGFLSCYHLKFKFYRLSSPNPTLTPSPKISYAVFIRIVPRTYPNPETITSEPTPVQIPNAPSPFSPPPSFPLVNKPLPPPPYHLYPPSIHKANNHDEDFIIPNPACRNPRRGLTETLSRILHTILRRPQRDRFDFSTILQKSVLIKVSLGSTISDSLHLDLLDHYICPCLLNQHPPSIYQLIGQTPVTMFSEYLCYLLCNFTCSFLLRFDQELTFILFYGQTFIYLCYHWIPKFSCHHMLIYYERTFYVQLLLREPYLWTWDWPYVYEI